MEPDFEFPISLPSRDSRNLLRALHGQLKAAILDGRLQPGSRLPPTRALATAYGVSRNTAVAAYDLLLSEGYLATRPRAGAYVADVRPRSSSRGIATGAAGTDSRLQAFWRRSPVPVQLHSPVSTRFDFRLGVPDKRFFPFDAWRRLTARAIRSFAKKPAAYAEPQGLPGLREAIAKHVSFARAVACRPEDIVVTAGSQQALDLLARILISPGRTVVAVENPGYPPLHAAFAAAGAKIAPVQVDGDGIVVQRLPTDTRVICVTPSHQFPLGMTMSLARRNALIAFAHERDAYVFEDDHNSEFRFTGPPLPCLQGLDEFGRVIYAGTMSKILYPSLRLGYILAPEKLVEPMIKIRAVIDQHSPAIDQATLARFLEEGYFLSHIKRMRKLYAERREFFIENFNELLGKHFVLEVPEAGLHFVAWLRRKDDLPLIMEACAQIGIRPTPLSSCFIHAETDPALTFGFAAWTRPQIREGLRKFSAALEAKFSSSQKRRS